MLTSSDLKKIITKKFGTQRALANAIGLKQTTVSAIVKKGLESTSLENAAKICKALDISLEDVLDNLIGEISDEDERKTYEAKIMYELYLADKEIQPAINRLLGYQPPSNSVSPDNNEGGLQNDD